MKFGISILSVLCAVLLSLDTLAAPTIDTRDESALSIRKTAVKAKAPVKKITPAPKKVVAPAKAVPKKAPVVAAPKKAPVVAAPKKAPVVAPPKKAPVVAAPKKAPVKTVPKKTVPKPTVPKKAPTSTPPKKSVSAVPKKSAAPKSSAAAPKPSASASTSCTFKSKSKTTKAKTTIKGRVVATKQFHATCKSFATSIKSAVQGGSFKLQPERIWPNEFTWSGGFYVTPDEEKAQLFGATFLADKCATKGGVVVMAFSLAQSALKVQEVPSASVNSFRTAHGQLGSAIQRFLKKQKAADTTPADPPVDENISTDDNPAVSPPLIALPTQAQLDAVVATKNSLSPVNKRQALLLQTLDDFKTVDVVAGAGPLTASQRVSIEDAGKVGIPALTEPFNQVVLVTDNAMKALSFVAQEDLPTCLAEKQPLLVDLLKKKAAAE
ncbi:hypothetical protein B0H15DRAFT_540976 [Mycena belliarum]|uniref:Uncharacterized protein n=1 Tax=Mycena belliarum TaxID=1033014 RepID=A0AAD6TXT2_9AGAR|nr:hypothetical protein B0H15DRAFT_540976 [Mycena belliae]